MPKTELSTQGYRDIRDRAAWFHLPEHIIIRLTGTDRIDWLQGQVTNDLRGLEIGSSIKACLCRPTGQLEAILSIYRTDDALLVLTDQPMALLNRVQNHVILEDVQAVDYPGLISTIQGPDSDDVLKPHNLYASCDIYEEGDTLLLRCDLTGSGGWIVTGCEMTSFRIPEASKEAVSIASLEAGIPVFSVDTGEKTLVPELGPDFIRQHISYTKGCYTGQEVIHRIHARGHTNRTWRGLVMDGAIKGGSVMADREVGSVHRYGYSPDLGWIASATLRKEVAPGDEITVHGVKGVVKEMPLRSANDNLL